MKLVELNADLITLENESKTRYLLVFETDTYRRYVEISEGEFTDLCQDLMKNLLIAGSTTAVLNESTTKIKYFIK